MDLDVAGSNPVSHPEKPLGIPGVSHFPAVYATPPTVDKLGTRDPATGAASTERRREGRHLARAHHPLPRGFDSHPCKSICGVRTGLEVSPGPVPFQPSGGGSFATAPARSPIPASVQYPSGLQRPVPAEPPHQVHVRPGPDQPGQVEHLRPVEGDPVAEAGPAGVPGDPVDLPLRGPRPPATAGRPGRGRPATPGGTRPGGRGSGPAPTASPSRPRPDRHPRRVGGEVEVARGQGRELGRPQPGVRGDPVQGGPVRRGDQGAAAAGAAAAMSAASSASDDTRRLWRQSRCWA